ncbi:MAG: VWA domain-containing protein [Acidobacteriota bacterium]|nr:VWA domain-containing protein [Acidobacteriota bacterium]
MRGLRRSCCGTGLACLLWVVSGVGQTTAQRGPGAAPEAKAGQAVPAASNAGQGSANSEMTTLRVRTNLVVIDVVVTDGKGNPVHGLGKESFTLTEGGRPQVIKRFEEHTVLPASETAKIAAAPKLPPGLFTNQTAAPANGPVNVLLLDYLNTPLSAQPYARQQLVEFLNKVPAGTRIAVFGLNRSLVMLQGFTSDPEVLKKLLSSKKGAVEASNILSNPEQGGPQGSTALSDNFSSDALDADQQFANVQRFQAQQAAFEQQLRVQVTLGAFELLSRYLVGIPGRKNLIWFSGSFPLSIEPNTNLQDAFDSVVRNDDEIRKTDNLLTRAQIAVYPVDARGVFSDPANSAVNGFAGAGPQNVGGSIVAGETGSAGAASQMEFLQQTAQEHETMQAMAEDTGGKAFINTNNLTQAVQQAVANGSNYYTLTYTPNNLQWDGRFRAIKVKVAEPGVKLAYRNGYYADDPNDQNRTIAGRAAVAVVGSAPSAMATAMMRGAPDPTEILLRVRVRPAASPPQEQPVQGNLVNPDPRVKSGGPYRSYGIDVVPDRREISCPQLADGTRRCAIEVATYVYDRDGQLIVTTQRKTSARLSATNYQEMLVKGMAFHLEVSVPVRGEYYLRTAVHDLTSGRIGAVEVPVSAVAHLQPLDALAAPAAAAPGVAPVVPAGPK